MSETPLQVSTKLRPPDAVPLSPKKRGFARFVSWARAVPYLGDGKATSDASAVSNKKVFVKYFCTIHATSVLYSCRAQYLHFSVDCSGKLPQRSHSHGGRNHMCEKFEAFFHGQIFSHMEETNQNHSCIAMNRKHDASSALRTDVCSHTLCDSCCCRDHTSCCTDHT